MKSVAIFYYRREHFAAVKVNDASMVNFQAWNENYKELNAESWLYLGNC